MAKQKKNEEVRKQTGFQSFKDFFEEFNAESDRAAVILGAARIDLELYHLLQHALLPNTSKTDDLLDGDSPLSTFSARINICYRLGLIDAELARSLHLIRKIRNIFAHETSGSSLNSGSHRDRVRELCTPFMRFKPFTEYLDNFFPKLEGASRDFRAVAALIVIRLVGGVNYIQPFQAHSPIILYPPPFFAPEEELQESIKSAEALGAETEIENAE